MPETTLTLKAKDLTKQSFDAIQASLSKTATHFETLSKEAQKTEKGITVSLNRIKSSLEANREGLQMIAIGAGVVAASTGLLAKSFVDAAMQMQRMKMGLTAVMGSAKDADVQLTRLKEVAKLPGLGLQEAIQGAIRLQVVGTSAEDAAKQLTAFGSAVARAGGGRGELARVVEQIAQMSAKGKVLTEDFRPIVSLMPDIMIAMDKAFGTKQIEKIREMGIDSKQFIAGITTELLKLPGVGNTAANSMENLSDTIFELKASLGEVLLPAFSAILNKVSEFVAWLNKLSSTQKAIISWGMVAAAAVATLTASFMGFLMIIPSIISGATALGITLAGLSAAAGPIGLAIAAVAALTIGIAYLIKRHQEATITSEKFAKSMEDIGQRKEVVTRIQELANRLEELRSKTNLTAQESQELVTVQNELAKLAPVLIAGFDGQGNAIMRAKSEVKKYTAEQLKLIENEREILILQAKRRLPELKKQLEEENKQLEKMNETLAATPIGERVKPYGEGLAARMLGETESYKVYLKRTKAQVQRVRELTEEYQDLQAQLRGKPYGPPPPPKKEMSEEDTKAIEKAAKIVLELRQRELELISDKYKKEREQARLTAEEKIASYKKEIKDSEQLDKAIVIEKQILAKTLTDIDREEAEERAKIAEKEAKEELKLWEDAHKIKIGITDTYVKWHEAMLKRDAEAEKDANKIKVGVTDTYFKWRKAILAEELKDEERASRIKVGLTDTYYKILIARRYQNLKDEEKAITKSVQAYEARIREHDYMTRKILDNSEKEIQAFYQQVEIMKKNEQAILDMKLEFADRAAQAISDLPLHLVETYLENRRIEQEAQRNIIDINKSAQEEIDSIRQDNTLSYIEKLRQIEQVEKESAARRKAIEKDLNESKKSYVADFVQSFLIGIARMIQAEMQRRIAIGIISLLFPATAPLAAAAPVVFGSGFDNPKHDAIARSAGFMYGASFDNPASDLHAKLRGTMSASKDLGERSAKDMVSHFSKGFEQGAAGQSQGVDNKQLQGVLSKIEARLSETPEYNFYLDGQQLHASVKRRDDKTNFRRQAY